EPAPDVVVIELLGPEEPRERLSHDVLRVVGELLGDDSRVELVRLAEALCERDVEVRPERAAGDRRVAEPEARRPALAGLEREAMERGRLGADPGAVDRVRPALDDVAVDSVLHIGRHVRRAPEARAVGVVLREQEHGGSLAVEPPRPERRVLALDDDVAPPGRSRAERRALRAPGVP